MKSGIRTLAALCSIAFSVTTGCTTETRSTSSDSITEEAVSSQVSGSADSGTIKTILRTVSENDMHPVTKAGNSIVFKKDGAEIKGNGISTNGNTVTITQKGYYSVSGSCPNGQLVIDCGKNDDVFILLDGVKLTCADAPALFCKKAGKVTLTLTEGSKNYLSDGSGYSAEAGEETGAALFSQADLVINGTGTLDITGIYKDGIKGKDGLKICGGAINVNAAEDGIIGKDYLIAAGGNITINSGLDGIKSTNSSDTEKGYISITGGEYSLTCGNDGIQAETTLDISDGIIQIITGGGSSTVSHPSGQDGGHWGNFHGKDNNRDSFDFSSLSNDEGLSTASMKGLKAGSSINITGGEITTDCADDAIHSNGTVSINGGNFQISSGDDGIHADTTLTISDGEIDIINSYEGLEASGIEINGGIIRLNAIDDGINACDSTTGDTTPYITISGGCITANAAGDGIDSNGTVSMSGGTLVIFGPTSGADGAIDYEKSFALSGGTLIAFGSKRMAQAPSTLSQPCISIYAETEANSTIEVRTADRKLIISTVTPKECNSLIFSSPQFINGETYNIIINGETTATVTVSDGVSGNGATGFSFGSWTRDDGPWGGNSGNNTDFTRPEKPDEPVSYEMPDAEKSPEEIPYNAA